jgi:hypothetical protein
MEPREIDQVKNSRDGIIFGTLSNLYFHPCFSAAMDGQIFNGTEESIRYIYKTKYSLPFITTGIERFLGKLWIISVEDFTKLTCNKSLFCYEAILTLKNPAFWKEPSLRRKLIIYTLLILRLFDYEFCLIGKINEAHLDDHNVDFYIISTAEKASSSVHYIHDGIYRLVHALSKTKGDMDYPRCIWNAAEAIVTILQSRKYLKSALMKCEKALPTEMSSKLIEEFRIMRREF